MDNLDRALAEAWHRLATTVKHDRAEAARRAARRHGALSRNIRPWCLALRAWDTRITPYNSLVYPGERAIPRRFPHKITIDAATLRRLCAPVYIPWPGILVKDAARRFGTTATTIYRWTRAGLLQLEKGDPLRGRFRHAVWTPSALDPNMDCARAPHKVWGSLWQHMHTRIPDDFSVTITRIPIFTFAPRRQIFRGWGFVCPLCTPIPHEIFGTHIDEGRMDGYGDPHEPTTGPRPSGDSVLKLLKAGDEFAALDALGKCAVHNLYLPLPPWRVGEALGQEDPLTDGEQGEETWHAAKGPVMPGCRACHRVEHFRLARRKDWNLFVSHVSGGLLYGAEVPMPEGMLEYRRGPVKRRHPREDEVFELALTGLRYKEIAARLGIGEGSVKSSVRAAWKRRGLPPMRELRRRQRFGSCPARSELTDVQRRVLDLLGYGLRRREIAQAVGVTMGAVGYAERQLRFLYGVGNRRELLAAVERPVAGKIGVAKGAG